MADQPQLSSLQYQVLGILGQGEHATVMKIASREVGGGTYALRVVKKETPQDMLWLDWARAEAEASSKLQHPAVLKTYDTRIKKNLLFQPEKAEQLMEFVDGQPLDKVKGISIGPAVLIFHKLAGALQQMHRRDVLHGDLRPRKVLLSRRGQVKMHGYGFSLVNFKYKTMLEASGPYVAPERAKEPVATVASDLYALGATMYQVLTGKAPAGMVARTEGKKLATPQAVNPRVPNALNNLVVACLSLSPDGRPKDAYEVTTELEKLVQQLGLDDQALAGLAPGAKSEES
jgi:serine/threonine-protein kinase